MLIQVNTKHKKKKWNCLKESKSTKEKCAEFKINKNQMEEKCRVNGSWDIKLFFNLMLLNVFDLIFFFTFEDERGIVNSTDMR